MSTESVHLTKTLHFQLVLILLRLYGVLRSLRLLIIFIKILTYRSGFGTGKNIKGKQPQKKILVYKDCIIFTYVFILKEYSEL